MKPRALVALIVLPVLLGTLSAAAHGDDDWDDDDDHRYARRHKGGDYKEEFWVGNCKIKRKWKDNGEYKEERKCKDRPVVYQPPPAVYYQPEPAFVVSPQVVIRP